MTDVKPLLFFAFQVVGLWIVLAATVAIALVLIVLRELELRYVRHSLRQLSDKMRDKVSSLSNSFTGLSSRSTAAAVAVAEEKDARDAKTWDGSGPNKTMYN